jgi:8-oxo-dGTP diphosphatase
MPRSSPPERTAPDSEWRDSQGRRLVDYPRPSVAVDVAVLTVAPVADVLSPSESAGDDLERHVLAVVVHRREWAVAGGSLGRWALPGAFVHERERLAEAVLRALRTKCGIEGLQPHQLRVFDDPDRDPRGWVMSVAHADVLPYARVVPVLDARPDVRLVPVPSGDDAGEGRGRGRETSVFRDLVLDHRAIIHAAVGELRSWYAERPDPARLLGDEPFTLLQLRLLHEAVLGVELQKDTFRRHMGRHLSSAELRSTGTVGKPAQLYRRRQE